jgi:hypothetical protein
MTNRLGWGPGAAEDVHTVDTTLEPGQGASGQDRWRSIPETVLGRDSPDELRPQALIWGTVGAGDP